jgi:cell division transport system permease protein
MNTIFYFLRETCANLYRSKLLTTISVITTGVLLFFLLILSLVMINIRLWISGNENQPQVSVYFDADISTEAESELIEKVMSAAKPVGSNFISRDSSYNIFKNLYGSEMLASVEENPFPPVLELTFSNDIGTSEINLICKRIGEFEGVESVVFSQEWLKKLQSFRDSVSRGLVIFAVIMILVVFFTIMNTIKLTVYAREDMIRNMQYIGASGWYIRTPFVLEGMFQGLLGASIAVIASFLVRIFIPNFDFYWGEAKLFAGIMLFGAALGFFGSFFAVKKFIKL